jgi:hypothetical protein
VGGVKSHSRYLAKVVVVVVVSITGSVCSSTSTHTPLPNGGWPKWNSSCQFCRKYILIIRYTGRCRNKKRSLRQNVLVPLNDPGTRSPNDI